MRDGPPSALVVVLLCLCAAVQRRPSRGVGRARRGPSCRRRRRTKWPPRVGDRPRSAVPWSSSTDIGRAGCRWRDGYGQLPGHRRDSVSLLREPAAQELGQESAVGEARGGDTRTIDRVAALDLAERRGGEFHVVDAGDLGGGVAGSLVPGVFVALQERDDVPSWRRPARSRFLGGPVPPSSAPWYTSTSGLLFAPPGGGRRCRSARGLSGVPR